MSSILKVDTIQDQNGNLIISKDSGGSGFLSPYASSSAAITYTVTVASKTSAHPYNGVGSSNGYFINGIESPIIEIKGNDTSKPYHYKFDQSDSSNSGHPLLFYNNVGKTTGFSTGVTTNGTPGQAGAYTMIAVDSQTPNILYYQCSSHANMGNHTFATSPVVNTGVFLTLPTADGSSGQVVTTNGSGVLSFANGSVPDDAITLAKMAPGTDGNIISYDTSGNPVAVATGNDGQVLTSAGAGAVPTFETLPAGTTLSGSTNNTVATVTGANALAGEANLTYNGTFLGVGANADLGVGVSIKTADSSASVNGDADELIIENGTSGASAGMSILSATNGYGSINFGDSADNNIGIIQYDHSLNAIKFFTNGAQRLHIAYDGSNIVYTTPPMKTFDFGGSSTVTLADGAYIEFTSTSGVWFVTEQSQTGLPAVLIAGGGQTQVSSQMGSTYTNSSGSGTFRWYRQSGGGYRFQNNQGNTCVFGFCHMSLRNGT